MDRSTSYDLIVLGGGPAGYTAALYGARAGLSVLVIEQFSAGGQMTQTAMIENYPGFDEGVDGYSLGEKMQKGAERFGAKTLRAQILSVQLACDPKVIRTDEGEYLAKTVIVATGAGHRHLGLLHEEELVGKGVGYCAACDGMFYRGKRVAVVGGGNSAAADALLLSRICDTVYLIHRRDTLRAGKTEREALKKADNIVWKLNSTVEAFQFEEQLTGITLKNKETGGTETLSLDGVFISIGREPQTKLFQDQLALSEEGYILAGEDTKTNLPGVFSAGDVREKPFRQIVTAVSDGAVAAYCAEQYLTEE